MSTVSKYVIEDLVLEKGITKPKQIEIKLKSKRMKSLIDKMPTLLFVSLSLFKLLLNNKI